MSNICAPFLSAPNHNVKQERIIAEGKKGLPKMPLEGGTIVGTTGYFLSFRNIECLKMWPPGFNY